MRKRDDFIETKWREVDANARPNGVNVFSSFCRLFRYLFTQLIRYVPNWRLETEDRTPQKYKAKKGIGDTIKL